jgi:hypothetical protein
LDGTGEPLSSALHRCSDELGFAIDSCVSICSIRGSELVKAFNLFCSIGWQPCKRKGAHYQRTSQIYGPLLKALRYTDEELKGSIPELMKKLAADGIDVSVTEKP